MYYHSVLTAITFMFMFLFWEILFSIIAWRSFVSWWQNRIPVPTPDIKHVPIAPEETKNITDDNQDDDPDTWLEVGRRGDTMERHPDDNGTITESESEYELVIKLV